MSKKFRTVFDRELVVSNPGSDMVTDFVSVYDDDGKRKLVPNGQHSMFDEIQSYRENCELKTILKRYVQTGDDTLLKRRQAIYADVTDIPKTYADVLRVANAAQEMFDVLSKDKKEAFNNNVDEFLAAFGSKKFEEIMNPTTNGGFTGDLPVEPIKKESDQ